MIDPTTAATIAETAAVVAAQAQVAAEYSARIGLWSLILQGLGVGGIAVTLWRMGTLEHNTNSIKDALVATTARESEAKGRLLEKEETDKMEDKLKVAIADAKKNV